MNGQMKTFSGNQNRKNLCGDAVSKVLFPKISSRHLDEMMMWHCGNTGPVLSCLTRSDDSNTPDDRLSTPYTQGHCVSVILYAACGTGDLELLRMILPMDGVHCPQLTFAL
jgi:hypothetical protein